ncbi:MAG: TolC family protein [Sideroxyarcus sp.]|nr:TolC family protein [Sideroxyarcus sp.]
MMNRFFNMALITVLSSVSAVVVAAPVVNPAGLLPTEIVRPLLEQDLAVASARASLDVAQQEAGILDKSPYEWSTRASTLQRKLESGARENEWNVGIEHTLRLPGKAAADRKIGKATIEESRARYGEALRLAARDLMALWVDWLAAERALALAETSLQSAQASLVAVEKRSRAGDASKLDSGIARAELAEQKRLGIDARTQRAVAWSRLSTRFPGVNNQTVALPEPMLMGESASFWRERILAQSDELMIVQAQLGTAQSQAERARADRIPDPTFGIYTASEAGGRERVSGVSISIPIPGGLRGLNSAKALAVLAVARTEVELKRRQLEAEIASAVATALGSYESFQVANEAAAAMQENADLMQKAYALGEAELQALLLARRQATGAKNSALQAQVIALKAYYGLLIDAHLIWRLEHGQDGS